MATPAAAPVASDIPGDTFHWICALLRDVRAESQNLQLSLNSILEKAALADPQQRQTEIDAALTKAQSTMERNRDQIRQRLEEVRATFQRDPEKYDWCGDEVTNIENFWDRAQVAWPKAGQPAEATLTGTVEASEYLDKMILSCGWLTVPSRLDELLRNLRIGQPLDFHWAFGNELPKVEQRTKILDDLARQPRAVEGVVDAPNGVIYRASPSAARRRASILLVCAAALLGVLLVYVFSAGGAWVTNWPITAGQFGPLLTGYIFVIVGAVIHLIVNALKQSRSESNRSFMAIQDWILWVHVKETAILWSIVYLWVGYFGLTWFQGVIGWQTAFFVGYSIDSFVDLFLERFQTAADSSIEAAKKQLGAKAA